VVLPPSDVWVSWWIDATGAVGQPWPPAFTQHYEATSHSRGKLGLFAGSARQIAGVAASVTQTADQQLLDKSDFPLPCVCWQARVATAAGLLEPPAGIELQALIVRSTDLCVHSYSTLVNLASMTFCLLGSCSFLQIAPHNVVLFPPSQVRPSLPDTSRLQELSEEAYQWLATRGISAETADRAGVKLENRYVPGLQSETPCLAFPYRVNGVVVNVKYRAITGKHFTQSKGCTKVFYGLDDVVGARVRGRLRA